MWYRTARICIERQCRAVDGGEVFTLNMENMSLRSNPTTPAGDIVQDSLNEDDANVDVAGDVREKFVEQIVHWVESVARRDARNCRGEICMDTRHILVREDGLEGIVE